jgi:hypothetical protein
MKLQERSNLLGELLRLAPYLQRLTGNHLVNRILLA